MSMMTAQPNYLTCFLCHASLPKKSAEDRGNTESSAFTGVFVCLLVYIYKLKQKIQKKGGGMVGEKGRKKGREGAREGEREGGGEFILSFFTNFQRGKRDTGVPQTSRSVFRREKYKAAKLITSKTKHRMVSENKRRKRRQSVFENNTEIFKNLCIGGKTRHTAFKNKTVFLSVLH